MHTKYATLLPSLSLLVAAGMARADAVPTTNTVKAKNVIEAPAKGALDAPTPALLAADKIERLQSLAKDVDKVSDKNHLEALVSEYNTLSAQELDFFNQQRMHYKLAELNNAYNDPQSIISEYQHELDVRILQLVTDLRIDVNLLSNARHGKPSNSITGPQLDAILDELMRGNYSELTAIADIRFQGETSTLSCPAMSFPETARKREGRGRSYYEYARVTKTGQSDCDWRFSYVGYYSYIDPENLDSWLLLRSFGNRTGMKRGSVYIGSQITNVTHIIFGANRVWFWCGGPDGVYVDMN